MLVSGESGCVLNNIVIFTLYIVLGTNRRVLTSLHPSGSHLVQKGSYTDSSSSQPPPRPCSKIKGNFWRCNADRLAVINSVLGLPSPQYGP